MDAQVGRQHAVGQQPEAAQVGETGSLVQARQSRQEQLRIHPGDREIVAEAKELGIDISAIAETALADAVRAEKERRWLEENREAIESLNRWVEENGLPFAEYRRF